MVQYGGNIDTVLLDPGLPPEELTGITFTRLRGASMAAIVYGPGSPDALLGDVARVIPELPRSTVAATGGISS